MKAFCECKFMCCELNPGDKCPIYKNIYIGNGEIATIKDWIEEDNNA